jgi:hypothetical protein
VRHAERTAARRAAWEFAGSAGLELVTINPALVLGPLLSAARRTSVELIQVLLGREVPAVPRLGFAVTDVRDVAVAHRLAMETAGAAGNRYIVAGEHLWLREMAAILAAEYRPRGYRVPTQLVQDGLVLAYNGLDDCTRRTRIVFDPTPTRLSESAATYQIRLGPGEAATFRWAIVCEVGADSHGEVKPHYEKVVQEAASALEATHAREPQIFASNEQFNDWLNRSIADLHMMRTETSYGPYPYAGVPWFSTEFGRDGIITALQCMWFDPSLARGVLAYLAATQADTENAEQDAQPGRPDPHRHCRRL